MKKQLILVPSEKMNSNKKDGRNEDKLIRMGEKARNNLGLKNDKSVELWPNGDIKGKINHNKLLDIFQAYAEDLKNSKETEMSTEDYNRVGFVTTRTFKYICGNKQSNKENIWVADTIEDTVIGADPEFMLIDADGELRYAANIEDFTFEGELGNDGPLAELRPAPAISIDDFIDNIRKILQSNPKRETIIGYNWIGGCFFASGGDGKDRPNREYPIGGHAHIGTPAQIMQVFDVVKSDRFRAALFSCLQKIIDEYISIPMLKVEGKESGTQRRQYYGRFGDFRIDHGRLECRTLSGMWLVHPELAAAVMGSVKAVSDAFYRFAESKDYDQQIFLAKGKKIYDSDGFSLFDQRADSNGWKDIEIVKALKATKPSAEMIDILQKGLIKFDKNYLDNLRNRFRSLSSYREYAKHIDAFMELLSLPSNELKKIDKNIKHNWLEGKKFII
jgi:hypothetical protein